MTVGLRGLQVGGVAGTTEWMREIPITRVIGTYVSDTPLTLHPHAASRVRGALEAQLRHVICSGCDGDWHHPSCLVPQWWRRPASEAPRWWLRVSPETGERVGPERPLVVEWAGLGRVPRPTALVEAFLRCQATGIGVGTMPLDQLVVQGAGSPAVISRERGLSGYWPEPRSLAGLVRAKGGAGATVWLRTPFQGPRSLGGRRPTAADWLRAAFGRVRAVARGLDVSLDVRWPEPQQNLGRTSLRSVPGSRSAANKPGRQPLGGWVGWIRIEDAVAWADLLAAAEVLGVGRGVTRGLGVVDVEWDG